MPTDWCSGRAPRLVVGAPANSLFAGTPVIGDVKTWYEFNDCYMEAKCFAPLEQDDGGL